MELVWGPVLLAESQAGVSIEHPGSTKPKANADDSGFKVRKVATPRGPRGPDWEKLAGEQGRTMTSSRLGRLGASERWGLAAASTAARQLTRSWSGRDETVLLQDSRFRRAQAEKVLKVLGELADDHEGRSDPVKRPRTRAAGVR